MPQAFATETEQEWVRAFTLDPAQAFGPAGQRVVFARLFAKATTRSIWSPPRAASTSATGSTTTCPTGCETKAGPIYAMPHAYEISDLQIFHFYKYKPAQFVEQVMDHFELLYREAATSGGRIVALSLRPWISGVPHRIAAVEQVLDRHAATRRRVVGDGSRDSRGLAQSAIGPLGERNASASTVNGYVIRIEYPSGDTP